MSIKDEVLKSGASVAVPGGEYLYKDFIEELQTIAILLDHFEDMVEINGVTHSTDMWAIIVKRKLEQLKMVLEYNDG